MKEETTKSIIQKDYNNLTEQKKKLNREIDDCQVMIGLKRKEITKINELLEKCVDRCIEQGYSPDIL